MSKKIRRGRYKRKKYPRETPEQRKWVLRRDNYQCQFIDVDKDIAEKCRSNRRLEVHHIVPAYYAYEFLKWDEKQVNNPENLITLCHYHHTEYIHPDLGIIARKHYKWTKDSYNDMLERHHALAREGVPYWQDEWDEILKIVARTRTYNYIKNHPDDLYPEGKYDKR